MNKLILLIVEDDETQIHSYSDVIDQFNKSSKITVIPEWTREFEEGKTLLNSKHFDAAIIDLRLASNTLDYKGVELVKDINGKLRIPIYIISASLGEVNDIEENILLQKRHRTDSFKNTLEELIDIFNSGITKLLKPKSFVDVMLTKIFWNHLPIILDDFIKNKKVNPEWEIEKVLLRYIASHINEYLELSTESTSEPFQSVEVYIKPPVKANLYTGDILQNKKDKSIWIIITPACDLATDSRRLIPKADVITLVHIQSLDSILANRNPGDVKKLKSNNLDLKYHYLPKTVLFVGGFINFQFMKSLTIHEVKNEFDSILVISSFFKKDIISRFANYYSRQGQPLISE